MNRVFGLIAAWGTTAIVFVGCSQTPPPSDGDDDDDGTTTGGSGGTGGVTCPPTQMLCGAVCASVATDPLNCGTCGRACGQGQQCSNGACACGVGFIQCGTGCTNVVSDPLNCGSCGNVCPATAQFCLGAQGCSSNCPGTVCGTACVNLQSDQTNCGACGNACSGGKLCTSGTCACPANTEACGAACVPTGTCNVGTGGTTGVGGTGGASGSVGTGGTAGSGTGGTTGGSSGAAPTGGTGGMITGNPPGWWTHSSWHGCTWTGVDIVAGTTTMSTPKDFTTRMEGQAYCVQGSVFGSYDSVALMGFNLNETPSGSATQCAYNPATATAMGPPGTTLTGTGLAINFTKTQAPIFRVQVQGPNGATDANNRWCANIAAATGPVFIPWSAFNTKCWEPATMMTGTAFNPANSPISAIAFLVPGTMGAVTPFSYCVTGFAAGSAATDAPTWGTGMMGPAMGTLGGPGGMNLDFQRVKIAKGGKSYIIQNNNWGNPNGSDQTLTYVDNSFTVTQSTGSGSQAPASFPSIFIGGNGDVSNGTYSTRSDDHLPKQISAITSANSVFRHTGTSGSLNATYDIWFSDHVPATGPAGRYDDAISGFVMLWLYDPPNAQPIGNPGATVTIGGKSWVRWVGPRGSTNAMCEGVMCNANRPVVSYVATSTSTSFSGDLKPFFTDAAAFGIPASWYLTDVFGGFECWSGGDCVGKKVEEFTVNVLP